MLAQEICKHNDDCISKSRQHR